MSEKIVAGNLDEVISKNAEICDEMREKAVLIRTNLALLIGWQCKS